MLAVVAAALLWSIGADPIRVGVLLLVGLGIGLPAGMLFKILPFLAWFHLQHRQLATRRFDLRIPHMGRLLPSGWARVQVGLQLLALLLLSAAIDIPALARPAGLALVAAALLLLVLLIGVVRTYRQSRRQLMG
jgi:hypothetical protein